MNKFLVAHIDSGRYEEAKKWLGVAAESIAASNQHCAQVTLCHISNYDWLIESTDILQLCDRSAKNKTLCGIVAMV